MRQFFINNTLHNIQTSPTWERICAICKQNGYSKFTNIAQIIYIVKREKGTKDGKLLNSTWMTFVDEDTSL